MVPTLVENSKLFVYLFVNFFLQIIIMTGKPMYTTSKERIGTVRPCYINNRLKSEVSITLRCQLCSTVTTQHYKSRTVRKVSLQFTHTTSKESAAYPSYINNHLKSEVSIMLHCQLCMFNPLHSSTNQQLFEKHLCNQSSHYEKYRRFPYEGKPSCATAKSTLFAVSKNEWTQRRTLVSP